MSTTPPVHTSCPLHIRHTANHYACTNTATPTPVSYTLTKQYRHPYTNNHSYINLSTLYQCMPPPPLQLQLQSSTYGTDNIAIIIPLLMFQLHLLYHTYEPVLIVTIFIIKLTPSLQPHPLSLAYETDTINIIMPAPLLQLQLQLSSMYIREEVVLHLQLTMTGMYRF